jgi:hypothetical protein
VATTHLRPTFFADWLVYPHFAAEIWAKKKIEFPFENGRHAPISTDDQGRVIAYILANPKGHEGKIYRGVQAEDGGVVKVPAISGAASRRSRPELSRRHLRWHKRRRRENHRKARAIGPSFHREKPRGFRLTKKRGSLLHAVCVLRGAGTSSLGHTN